MTHLLPGTCVVGCTGDDIRGLIILGMFTSSANCLKFNANIQKYIKTLSVGVTLTRPTLIGSMCVLVQLWWCCLGPQVPFLPPHGTYPCALLFMGQLHSHLGVQLTQDIWRPHSGGHPIPGTPGGARGSSRALYHAAVFCLPAQFYLASDTPCSLPRSPWASLGPPEPHLPSSLT